MPAPSQLAIQTSALQRRVKEEASYHKELEQQKTRIDKLQQDLSDENAEYTLRQERKAVDETLALFPRLRQQIQDDLEKLEATLEQNKSSANPEEMSKAEAAIAAGKEALQKSG